MKQFFAIFFLTFIFSNHILGNDQDSPLCRAIKTRNIPLIKKLLTTDIDINYKNFGDKTALHCAIEEKSIEMTKLILAAHPELNAQAVYGWTPLHWAVYVDSPEIVQLLLKAGADINIENNYNYNALGLAVYYNRVTIAQDLIKTGASLSYSGGSSNALWSVCKDNRAAMLKVLILLKMDLDNQNNKEHDWTPLHLAVYKDYYTIASILVSAGASRSIMDRDGFIALDYAQSRSMQILLQR